MNQPNLETNLDEFDSKKLIKWLAWIFTVASMAIGVVFFFYFRNFKGELSQKNEVWGTFGDFIGGTLNPILSFLALIALLLTIILQSRELEATREEFKRSADALNEQSKSLVLQSFENTFFQMLRLHNDIVKDMFEGDADTGNKGFSGRDCFGVYHQNFDKLFFQYEKASSNPDTLELIQKSYTDFYFQKQSSVGHYFRNLYTIIKFVDSKKILLDDKKHYTNIIRAQLSSYELALLFYNCLSSVGINKFKPLIEKYELLENMDFELLTTPKEQIPLYDGEAYGEISIPEQYKI